MESSLSHREHPIITAWLSPVHLDDVNSGGDEPAVVGWRSISWGGSNSWGVCDAGITGTVDDQSSAEQAAVL